MLGEGEKKVNRRGKELKFSNLFSSYAQNYKNFLMTHLYKFLVYVNK